MMRLSWKKRSKLPTSALIRRRRHWRFAAAAVVAALAVLCTADHLGAFGYRGDDWARFDRASGTIERIVDAATVEVNVHGEKQVVQLLGLSPAVEVHTQMKSMLQNQNVRLKLEPLQPRDRQERLLAYLYIDDAQNVNLSLIKTGCARADRNTDHSMRTMFQLAESAARKSQRGIWSGD
jgi:endonuclease YncB( thermonuclease family)